MTDRELLEAAARAAGIADGEFHGPIEGLWSDALDDYWNPLTNDGDALRLAVKLHLIVDTFDPEQGGVMSVAWDTIESKRKEPHGDDPIAATRRAIVRAAAAMAPPDIHSNYIVDTPGAGYIVGGGEKR